MLNSSLTTGLFVHNTEEPPPDDFGKMKAVQLKGLCKEFGLKTSGKKEELQTRLREHLLSSSKASDEAGALAEKQNELDVMTDRDLSDSCAVRGLSSEGTREELLERLREDIFYAAQVAAATPANANSNNFLVNALEASGSAAAKEIMDSIREKSMAEPKFVEVTITSIGMAPEKYTAGGAPSVTSDVLKKLAGDPFRDPPKYGSVSTGCHCGLSGYTWCQLTCRLSVYRLGVQLFWWRPGGT